MIRAYGAELRRRYRLAATVVKVMWHIVICRTALLGGHLDACDACGFERPSYNSCGDRHCPKCQAIQRARWVAERMERLLPVPCFHVVFTLPAELRPLALRNKRLIYTLLFKAASSTLLTLTRDPKRLGAEVGITAVLHTWGQILNFHPHLHCIVTGGGLALDGSRWKPGRQNFLLPLGVLSKLFRGRFLADLQRARDQGELDFAGCTAELEDPRRWAALRNDLYSLKWNIHAKPAFGGIKQVLRYLGSYTHRVAISNHRLVDMRDGKVSFTYKDYRDGSRRKLMTLDAVEFLRRFLLHVLPKGFVRIRHYGLWAARNVPTKLVTARRLLGAEPATPAAPGEPRPWWERFFEQTGVDVCACPLCKTGRLQRVRPIQPLGAYAVPPILTLAAHAVLAPVARSP